MLGIEVGATTWVVGQADLLHGFFSTVSARLEPQGWGSRFPVLLGELYPGTLDAESASAALVELLNARRELAALPPSAVVWDVDDRAAVPPVGSALNAGAPDLSQYFITADGRDLVIVLAAALHALADAKVGTLQVVELPGVDRQELLLSAAAAAVAGA